ncbi:MAG: hypothetical protein O8C64_15290 [Candidatus Methanoperedens sp.]|nr:hypothetical protein [Candidatus Methanoperedens sp.]
MEMTRANKQTLIFGPILLLVAVVVLIFWKNAPTVIISVFTSSGLALIIIGIYRHIRYGVQAVSDERTRKISALALTYSWFITLIFVGVLGYLNEFSPLEIPLKKVLANIILVMIGTFILFYAYFARKGDLE